MAFSETYIADLRHAFKDVLKPKQILACQQDWCSACLNQEQCNYLLKMCERLHDYSDDKDTLEIIQQYIFDAIWTVGNAEDFKFLTPKILETALINSEVIDSPNTFCKKLELAGFNGWNDTKKSSVEKVLSFLISRDVKKRALDFDEWMSGICWLDIDKGYYLKLLEEDYASNAREELLKMNYIKSILKKRMSGAYWDDLPAERTQIFYDWLVAQPPY